MYSRRGLIHIAGISLICATVILLAFSRSEPNELVPIQTGRELLLVFIASSSCPGIDDPLLPDALLQVRNGLRAEARVRGLSFATIGVSLDWEIDEGIRLLQRFGPFSEIAVGRSWINSGALHYIWRELPGEASVPQIVIVEREIVKGRSLEVADERVRLRKVGANQIVRWSQMAFVN